MPQKETINKHNFYHCLIHFFLLYFGRTTDMKEQNAVNWEGAHMLLKSSSFGNFVLPTRVILSHTLVAWDRGAIQGDIVTKHWFTHTFHWCRMVTFKRNTKTNPDLSLRGHPRTVAQDKGSSRGSFISTSVQVVTSLTCSIFVYMIMFKIEIYGTLSILEKTLNLKYARPLWRESKLTVTNIREVSWCKESEGWLGVK